MNNDQSNVRVVNFPRLMSSSVLVQVFAAPDSRFLLLPVLEQRSQISGWLVYDTEKGELIDSPGGEPWEHIHEARSWVIDRYYKAS